MTAEKISIAPDTKSGELPDILDEAIRHGAKLRRQSEFEYAGPCPRCGGRDRFAVNIAKQLFVCRRAGVGGDVIELVRYLDNVDFLTALGILGTRPRDCRAWCRGAKRPAAQSVSARDDNRNANTALALQLWHEAVPIPETGRPTLYYADRHLAVHDLGDLSHVLRWHARKSCIVALMTDTTSNAPTGVHRTFLTIEGHKICRKMLGRRGVIRLSTDEEVHEGLGLVEGVEDGLAVMLSGWRPIWVGTCDAEIRHFPILSGIEALTIFADADHVGMTAAEQCASRWIAAGREVCVSPPIWTKPR